MGNMYVNGTVQEESLKTLTLYINVAREHSQQKRHKIAN